MQLFKSKTKNKNPTPKPFFSRAISRRNEVFRFSDGEECVANGVYAALRRNVPIIDAALSKTVRLCGGYTVTCENRAAQSLLDDFVQNIKVGVTGRSLGTFTDCYLDSLLTFGNSVGEIVFGNENLGIAELLNVKPDFIEVDDNPYTGEREIFYTAEKDKIKLPHPERILFSALNPPAGKKYGVSVLAGLPSLSSVLLRIYECIGQNYDRIGNIRYAVTYNPGNDPADRAFAGERVKNIAETWADGMNAAANGEVRDFIAAGDVDIKVIGADNPLIDTEVPVRQLLEEIIAKLGIPPFLLGLSWSTTERMSQQQCDILTSELEYYRRIITPVIVKICSTFLLANGYNEEINVEWDNINLLDETELAEARLKNAQAAKLEQE